VLDTTGTIIGTLLRAGNQLAGKYMVVAVDTITGNTFHGFTDANGAFSVDLKTNTFSKGIGTRGTGESTYIVSIVGEDGQTVGTVTYGQAGTGEALTGIKASSGTGVDLGKIDIPQDPTTAPITPENDVSNITDNSITARTDSSGVPVGLDSLGKGSDDVTTATTTNKADKDGDGLVDVLDADDDGDGIADDFDTDTEANASGDSLFHVSIGQLLDIESADYLDYYNTTDSQKQAALVRDLRLDILVEPTDPNALTKPIVKVEVMEQPGPSYLPTLLAGPADNPYNWKDQGYTLTPTGDSGGFGANLMLPTGSTSFFKAGDSFVIKVWQGDYPDDPNATYTVLSRMLNYVFNYPSSYRFTSNPVSSDPDDMVVYDPTIATDINFNGAESEFVFIMAPPKDENGNPITTGGTFELKIAFEAADHQIAYFNEDEIRNNPPAGGWPAGWDGVTYMVNMEDLNYTYAGAPSPNDEMLFQVRVPMEVFPDTVTEWDDPSGSNPRITTVAHYGLGTRFIIRDSMAQNSISMTKQ